MRTAVKVKPAPAKGRKVTIRKVTKVAATPAPVGKVKARKVHTTTMALPERARPVRPATKPQTFASPVTNKNKSRTALKTGNFGKLTNAVMTDRDVAGLRMMKDRFGARPFNRAGLDAGIIRRLGERGKIEFVDGDIATENARFKLTRAGLSY